LFAKPGTISKACQFHFDAIVGLLACYGSVEAEPVCFDGGDIRTQLIAKLKTFWTSGSADYDF
jgi:hypothetical protein